MRWWKKLSGEYKGRISKLDTQGRYYSLYSQALLAALPQSPGGKPCPILPHEHAGLPIYGLSSFLTTGLVRGALANGDGK